MSHARGFVLRSSYRRASAGVLIAFGIGLAMAATAVAEPNGVDQAPTPPGVAPPGQPLLVEPAPAAAPPATAPAATACSQFGAALRVSSKYYNEFAYSIAGEGARVDYQDPTVSDANVDGRAALRKSAAEAFSAAGTPGLQPEIAAPMRSWSVDATKLLLVMGLRGGGDTLNKTATELNDDANNARMACANAGTPA